MRQVKKVRNADLLFEKKPKRVTKLYGELRAFLEGDRNVEQLHLDVERYSGWDSYKNALRTAIKYYKFPIWIITKNHKVYLVRNDT